MLEIHFLGLLIIRVVLVLICTMLSMMTHFGVVVMLVSSEVVLVMVLVLWLIRVTL